MNLAEFRKNLRYLERIIEKQRETGADCCGVTLTQCHAILAIGNANNQTISDLTKRLDLDKSTVSRTINSLVKKDIVKRSPDSKDRRYLLLNLTQKGKKTFAEINDYANQKYNEIFSYIPKEKHQQILESFSFFVRALAKVEKEEKDNCGRYSNV